MNGGRRVLLCVALLSICPSLAQPSDAGGFDVSGGSGYNEGHFESDASALNDLTASIGLPVGIRALTIKPSVGCSVLPADDPRKVTASSDNIRAGISFGYVL